jgi:hypothetical protein
VIIYGALRGIYKWGFNNGSKVIRRTNLLAEYERIYAPIYGLFLTKHLSITRAIIYPFFSQRFNNSKLLIKSGKIRDAILALFNEGETNEMAGFEYGDVFPIDGILEIVKGNEPYAEQRLLNLISSAHKSRMEELVLDETVLTDEEIELLNFVNKRYSELHRFFGPK